MEVVVIAMPASLCAAEAPVRNPETLAANCGRMRAWRFSCEAPTVCYGALIARGRRFEENLVVDLDAASKLRQFNNMSESWRKP